VEVAVQVVERWVLARLRHRRFFSLGELNAAIRRRALFGAIEQIALLSLPTEPFEYAEQKRCRPGLDYHIDLHGHWYSVPYRLIREVVEARITDRTVEIFHRGARVAVHVRNPCRIGTAPFPSTCRVRIGATPIGHRPGCGTRQGRSAQQRRG
jgi:transposase